jgi:dTDP-4-dehydrorhamnose 3,5-epimerase-like enzyme
MSQNDEIRRHLGAGMLKGDHYDLADQASTVRTIDGAVIVPVGESRNGWKNEFGVPVKLYIRGGKVQTYELLWDEQ